MVAVMALMEAPAIVVGMLLMPSRRNWSIPGRFTQVLSHAFQQQRAADARQPATAASPARNKGHQGPSPPTSSKGFLAVFLLDMGISSGRKLKASWSGWFNTGVRHVVAAW